MMSTTRAVFSPTVDLLTAGALSIITVALIFALGIEYFQQLSLAQLLTVATLVNGAHFTASYRMLYFSRAYALKHRTAAIYLPIALGMYGIWALYAAVALPSGTIWIQLMLVVAALYLALHYTGQTFGMIASYAFVEQIKLETRERALLKLAMKLLMFWQVCWVLTLISDLPVWLADWRPALMNFGHACALFGALLGCLAFSSVQLRIKRALPLRMLVPFAALLSWYALLYHFPPALVVVQFFHAIQYLIFPTRVEINRAARMQTPRSVSPNRHLLEYLFTLTFTAGVIFLFMPWMVDTWDRGYSAYVQVLIAAINIHHFYIDGVVWKISHPVVREELFAHLAVS